MASFTLAAKTLPTPSSLTLCLLALPHMATAALLGSAARYVCVSACARVCVRVRGCVHVRVRTRLMYDYHITLAIKLSESVCVCVCISVCVHVHFLTFRFMHT